MDIFNIGTPEVLLLLSLLLLLFGPEELLLLARRAGRILARLKRLWEQTALPLTQELLLAQDPPQESDDAGPSAGSY